MAPGRGLPSLAYWAGIVGRLTAAHRAGRPLLLLSDFDGTLAPIVRNPAEAWLPATVREDLRTLAACERIVVGIVSGRSLADLQVRVGLSSIIYAGCHGLEVAGFGLAFQHDGARAQQAELVRVADELRARTAWLTGVTVEAKRLSVAVHYRNAGPAVLPPLQELVRNLVDARPGYTVVCGRKVLEVLPTPDWDKGRCLQWIERRVEARLGDRVTIAYLGDDTGDEPAFAALQGRGITVRVGEPAPTTAAYRLPRVEDVHRLLSALADHVGEQVAR